MLTAFIKLRTRFSGGSCRHVFHEGEELIGQLSDYQLLLHEVSNLILRLFALQQKYGSESALLP
jgi:hypothetical protein